jgi:ribosomal protein L36
MKASEKKEVLSAKLRRKRILYVINKRTRFKQRQGYYGKNSRVDIPKTREVL